MAQQSPTFSSSSAKGNSPLFVIVAFVIALHVLLLGLGTFWNLAPPTPKPRAKILVQTIALHSSQSEIAQHRASVQVAPPASIATPIPAAPLKLESPPTLSIPEEIPSKKLEKTEQLEEEPLQPEISAQKEIPVVVKTPESMPVPAPPLPAPVKKEIKPLAKPSAPKPVPKPTPQAPPKKEIKPAAPVKKPVEPAKKIDKTEPLKSKQAEEAEKKKQQANIEAEKKKQQEKIEAEKKKQQEKVEAEKKRVAEAEKKRQQEIAAAQEITRQKIAKAKENFAKIGETRDKLSSSPSVNLESTSLPKELSSLHVDALPLGEIGGSGNWGTKEASYSDGVAYRLKMNLKLPDYGAVKIKLTLDRSGKVNKVEIVKSESNKNKAYVESKIPTLLFSPFGQNFQGLTLNTFVITLQNDS